MRLIICTILFFNILSINAQRALPIADWLLSYDYSIEPENITSNEYYFEQVGGLIFIKASYNNKEAADFILDTGSEIMILNGIPNEEEADFEAISVNGKTSIEQVAIDNFEWANLKMNNQTAYKLDLKHIENLFDRKIDGLIGQCILKEKELLIDYSKNKLVLFDSQERENYYDASVQYEVPIKMFEHFATITLIIGGKKYRFAIDTGSEVNLMSERILKNKKANFSELEETQKILGSDNSSQENKKYIFEDVELNKSTLHKDIEFVAFDMSIFNSEDSLPLHGILGYPFLKDFIFSINLQKKMFYIWSDESISSSN